MRHETHRHIHEILTHLGHAINKVDQIHFENQAFKHDFNYTYTAEKAMKLRNKLAEVYCYTEKLFIPEIERKEML